MRDRTREGHDRGRHVEAKLVVVGGNAKARQYDLELPTVIGRSRSTDLMLRHPLVSREHCEVFESNGMLMVRDLGSLNGTFVGETRIAEQAMPVKPGDLITVGPVTFQAVYNAGGRAHQGGPLGLQRSDARWSADRPVRRQDQPPAPQTARYRRRRRRPARAELKSPANRNESPAIGPCPAPVCKECIAMQAVRRMMPLVALITTTCSLVSMFAARRGSPEIGDRRRSGQPIDWPRRRAPICCCTRTIRSIGTPGGTRRWPRPGPKRS